MHLCRSCTVVTNHTGGVPGRIDVANINIAFRAREDKRAYVSLLAVRRDLAYSFYWCQACHGHASHAWLTRRRREPRCRECFAIQRTATIRDDLRPSSRDGCFFALRRRHLQRTGRCPGQSWSSSLSGAVRYRPLACLGRPASAERRALPLCRVFSSWHQHLNGAVQV